ncbi:metal-dependent hydrolase [Phenylobacterium sp.]|jgi:membrane-bound metal-dependent hydrolase YbcI (DUF457 family)|uniref:metal-dependent hydrolase n=1 Tax=Phenylobacterium sp. TaxID=1871053 RepID=UPI002F3ECD2C
MFAGHYAAALAAKSAEPRAPLWSYAIACQFLDLGWAGLIMTGAEKASIDPSLPGSPLVLYDMPWTHSLPGSLAWSVAGALLARFALRVPWRAAAFIGLAVFSHWLADLLVHRPDLLLWPNGPKVGLGLWNSPVAEQAVEIGLLAVTGVFWTAWRLRDGRPAWPAAAFLTVLVALQIYAMSSPEGGSPGAVNRMQTGGLALLGYGAVALVAWLVERGPSVRPQAPERLPAS